MQAHPFTMVVGVDLSEYADTVIEHAFDQALRHDAATIRVVTVIPDRRDEVSTKARLSQLVGEALDDVVPEDRRGEIQVFAHVLVGRPEEELVELAEEVLASLIVVGRFGAAHRAHGASVADPIVAGAGCPVLVVPAPRDTTASDKQFPACVEMRANSGGDALFCERHHGERLGHSLGTVSGGGAAARSMW